MRMSRLALTGGMYSGKSTLARYLGEQKGYTVISFTDLLKGYAVDALAACGIPLTVELIHKDKSLYRPFLQELGSVIGFSTDPKYVYEALSEWRGEPVVFDNVRTAEQWSVLQSYGFILVEIQVDEEVRRRRAGDLGVAGTALQTMLKHPIEGRLEGYGEIVLDGALSPEHNARLICLYREEEMRR